MASPNDPDALQSKIGRTLFEDFEQHFDVVYAKTEALRYVAYQIRKEVLCKEIGESSEAVSSPKLIDSFDRHAHHILMRHKDSQEFVGSARLIVPHTQAGADRLSIGNERIEQDPALQARISTSGPGSYGEISALALRSDFQRREVDAQPFSSHLSASAPPRDFPKMTMGLYLACLAVAEQLFLSDVFATMTPMLFKKLRCFGLMFEQASRVFDMQGAKAVYCLPLDSGVQISKTLYDMHACISRQLATQLALFPDVSAN